MVIHTLSGSYPRNTLPQRLSCLPLNTRTSWQIRKAQKENKKENSKKLRTAEAAPRKPSPQYGHLTLQVGASFFRVGVRVRT